MGVLTHGWITGLTAEARLLHGVVEVGGGLPAGAEQAAERAAARGATALISFGLAGGLDPALPAGTLVIPRFVVGDMTYATDPEILGVATHDRLAEAERILATASEKAALFRATGAAAVDLESGAVAKVAARRGLPFAVLRAICDPATSDLPPAALAALDGGGMIGAGRVLGSIAGQPSQIWALLHLARDAAAARRTLRERLKTL